MSNEPIDVLAQPATWLHKDEWKREGKGFDVVVSRHTVSVTSERACYDSEGPHRWCVYVYVYRVHPMFEQFAPGLSGWEQPTPDMHGGCTYFRTHRKENGEVVSFQFGCDYHHDGDWRFTQFATNEDAYEVFADANELYCIMELRENAALARATGEVQS